MKGFRYSLTNSSKSEYIERALGVSTRNVTKKGDILMSKHFEHKLSKVRAGVSLDQANTRSIKPV